MSNKTAGDLTDLIIQNAYKIREWEMIANTSASIGSDFEAKGLPRGYYSFNQKKLNEIADLANPLIKESQVIRKIEMQNTKDIINLVKKGKISAKEGVALMNLEKAKLEVEDKKQQLKMKKEMTEAVLKELDEEDD